MRAVIASRFAAYGFADVDRLDFDDLCEHYDAALWLGDMEAKAMKRTGRDLA